MTIIMNKTLLSTTGDMQAAGALHHMILVAHHKWVSEGKPDSGI